MDNEFIQQFNENRDDINSLDFYLTFARNLI